MKTNSQLAANTIKRARWQPVIEELERQDIAPDAMADLLSHLVACDIPPKDVVARMLQRLKVEGLAGTSEQKVTVLDSNYTLKP